MATNPKLILWDLDGTLCPHNTAFALLAPRAVAAAALKFDIPMTPIAAQALACQHFNGQRACIRAFATRFDLDEDALFERYYHHLDPSFLASDAELIRAFRQLSTQATCGVLTHAPEIWAHRALEQLRLRPYFDEALIIGQQRLGGTRKAGQDGSARLLQILAQAGYQPATVALVDDKLPVLEKLAPCAHTRIWLQDPRDRMTPAPAGVLRANTPLEAVQMLNSTTIINCLATG